MAAVSWDFIGLQKESGPFLARFAFSLIAYRLLLRAVLVPALRLSHRRSEVTATPINAVDYAADHLYFCAFSRNAVTLTQNPELSCAVVHLVDAITESAERRRHPFW